MLNQYNPLTIHLLPVATKLARPQQALSYISLDDPAFEVMTDLKKISAATISVTDSIDEASYKMKIRQINQLFVLDHNEYLIGLVTSTDLHGKRLNNFIEETGTPGDSVCMLDIMTGIDMIDILSMEEVNSASVGDILATLNKLERQHTLVLEENSDGKQIRGIFSLSQIVKQLSDDADYLRGDRQWVNELVSAMG